MSKKINNGAFSTNRNIEVEAQVSQKYIEKFSGEFFLTKGEWENTQAYDELGLPKYTDNDWDSRKNPVDLVRKNQIIDFKSSQSEFIALSEVVIGCSSSAAAKKIGQEADYIVEIINRDLTESLRVNVTQLMKHGDFISPIVEGGKQKIKLYLKRLIPGHFKSSKCGRAAHLKIIKALMDLNVGTYGDLYRGWDL